MAVLEATRLKTCNRCEEEKPLDSFYKRSASKDGLQGHCKLCQRHISKETMPKYYESHPEWKLDIWRKYAAAHPTQYGANVELKKAVAVGKVSKPETCEDCGGQFEKKRIHGHHNDYSKPLEVEWLCHDCHFARHTKELI